MSDSLRSRIHDVRDQRLEKTALSWEDICKRRAQAMYLEAVLVSGGYSATATSEACDESTVRDRCHDPRKIPALRHALAGLSRDGLYELAKQLCDFADELEGARRAG